MEKSAAYLKWKTSTKKLIKRGLGFVCKLDKSGNVTAYISRFPEAWGCRQCDAYFNLTMKIMPELNAQFSRKREAVTKKSSLFASLSATLGAIKEPDKEMRELDSESQHQRGGHWKDSMMKGVKYWFCERCGRTYWWVMSGCGRDRNGVPHVFCYHCFPPQPGRAVACGRGELTQEAAQAHYGGDAKLANTPPTEAGAVWEATPLSYVERRAWVALAATAPTPEAAWRAMPESVRTQIKASGGIKGMG